MLLVIFLLVFHYSVVSSISSCHSNRNKDHRTLVSCVSQGLTAVPDGIDPGTEVLILSHNAFVSLSWAAYTAFMRLHELDLSQNNINTIHHSGPVMKALRVLRLSNNSLTGLEGVTFKSTPSLMEIYLDGNNISSLDNATFSDLPLIELINLSRNKLHILPSHLLKHISSINLKNFDLEENSIRHLPDDFFVSKEELPFVFLSNNSWVCTCQVRYLKHFLDDQSHNVYRHTGPSSIQNDPESVVCSSPPMLRGLAIMNLEEEEYCSSDSEFIVQESSREPETGTVLTASTPTTFQPTTERLHGYSITLTPSAVTTIMPTIVKPTTIEQTTLISSILTTILQTTPTPMPKTVEYTFTTTLLALTTNNPTTITLATTKQTTLLSNTTTPTPTAKTAEYRPTPILPAQTTNNPTTITLATTKQTTLLSKISTATSGSTPTSSHTTTPTPTAKTAEYRPTPILTSLTTSNPTTSRSITMVTGLAGGILSAHSGVQHSVPWCWWLFITVLLLCIFSAISSCILLLWLIITYITLYQPIKRQVHRSQGVTLRAYQVTEGRSWTVDRPEEESVLFLPPEMIRETQPVFRSVLFISKGDEDCEVDERKEDTRNVEKEKKRVADTVTKIDLLPTVTLHREQETESKGRVEVFRKTLYRVISREEEIEGFKEVEENFLGVMERDKGRIEGGVEREKTRYSLILREERKSEMESRKRETEWLVGEWELKGGGE